MSMTDAEIREALARAERATPGPWEITAGGGHKAPSIRCPESYHACGVNVVQTDRSVISSVSYTNEVCEFPVQDVMGTPEAKAVAEFIAHARTDVPRLAADLLAARAERDEARQRAERFLQEINRLGQCAEDARDGERREYARAEAAETELAELRRWKDTHSVGSTLRTRAETAERERDEARAFLRDFLHTTSGKKSLDGAPLSRLESAAQRLLSPPTPHTCQLHRAASGASDCGLSPCEEATVHRDRGASRPKMRCAICGLVEHVGRCASSPPPSPEATPFEADTMTHEEAKCATCGGRGTVCAVPDGYHHGCANPAHAKPCPDCHGCGGGA